VLQWVYMRGCLRLLMPVLVLGCVDLGKPQGVVVLDALPGVTDRPPDGRDGTALAGASGGGTGGSAGATGGSSSTGGNSSTGGGSGMADGGPGGDPEVGPSPTPDMAEPDAPLSANGAACTGAAQCSSGFCVDGICCNSACTGACQACDIASSAGTCSPIADGQDPINECEQQAVSTCGTDGACNGSGACRKYAAGTQCAPGRCTGSTEYAASTCNAAGACTAGNMRSCAPNMCTGDSCASTCSGANDCQSGFFCDGGTCRSKRPNGMACTVAGQCASNTCVDGVCCATACTGTCQACNLSGSVGACTSIADGMDPGGECPAQAASTCGRSGGCDGRGACKFHPGGTSCGAASCSGSTETAASTCNGAGSCTAGATRTCPGFLCSGTTCGTSCTSTAQCQANRKCVRSVCAPLKIAGLVVHDDVAAQASAWLVQQNFQIGTGGAHPWFDYPDTYVASLDSAGNFFLGNEWIRVHAQSKKYVGGPQATITLNGTADVYLLIDDRWGTNPSFLAGWSNAGFKIQVFEIPGSQTRPFSVFRKIGQTGSVTTPQIGASTAFNYFVIVD
jgi:hypothetical protein